MTVGRVHEILEIQASAGEHTEIYLVAQRLSVGGQHARLKMPTIHTGIEPTFFLARTKVSSKFIYRELVQWTNYIVRIYNYCSMLNTIASDLGAKRLGQFLKYKSERRLRVFFQRSSMLTLIISLSICIAFIIPTDYERFLGLTITPCHRFPTVYCFTKAWQRRSEVKQNLIHRVNSKIQRRERQVKARPLWLREREPRGIKAETRMRKTAAMIFKPALKQVS